jgi:hypothetical protein
MDVSTFCELLDLLEERGGLNSSRFITSAEKVMMFIHILVGFSVRQTAERFQHSTETIVRNKRQVMCCMKRIKPLLIGDPDPRVVHERLRDPKYESFRGVLGAFDGYHIAACIPEGEQSKGIFKPECVCMLRL